jgi:hypothetical protein
VKLGEEMEKYSSLALTLGMIAAFLLVAGGVKLAVVRETRTRGILMVVAALVILMNVMIWTV